MKQHYTGLDVSLSETSICIVDEKRKVVKEGRVGSEPETIAAWLTQTGLSFERVGLEAGSLAPATHDGLQAGWYRVVHVKSRATRKLRAQLCSRERLVKSRVMLDNHLHGILKAFGLKVGKIDAARLERRVRELVDGDELLKRVVGPILAVRQETVRRLDDLHGLVLAAVKADPICRLLVTVPGVGPVTALAFRTAVEDPTRFAKSSLVGAHFGLTPRRCAFGETDRSGGISRCGDRMMRSLLRYSARQPVSC